MEDQFIQDSSFKFGFGLFETFRAINNKLIFFEEHIERISNSLKEFNLPQIDKDEIKYDLEKILKEKNINSARVRITYSLRNDIPYLTYEVQPFRPTFDELIKIKISDYRVLHEDKLRKHKTTSYFVNYYEYLKSIKEGFQEAIFLDNENHLLEGTRTNIFLIQENKIYTPKITCGVLPGIARRKIIEICKELNYDVIEREMDIKEIDLAEEIFLTNSLNGVVLVKSLANKIFSINLSKFLKEEFEKKFYQP